MKVLFAKATNFQSYKELEFNYSHLGLVLISGETGAGKSTLLDLVSWTLFGVTSKEGKADDAVSWGAKETSATLTVAFTDCHVKVTRTRGKSNDLYWSEEEGGADLRGKDLTETQKLLEARLGVTADLFLTASYLTQFSKADEFFISKAKDRRDVLEKIADQDFAIKLGVRSSEARKAAKKEAETLEAKAARLAGQMASLEGTVVDLKLSASTWKQTNLNEIAGVKKLAVSFHKGNSDKAEALKSQKNLLDGSQDTLLLSNMIQGLRVEADLCSKKRCNQCSGPTGHKEREEKLKEISILTSALRDAQAVVVKIETLTMQIDRLYTASNPHTLQLEALQKQTNPFVGKVSQYELEAAKASLDHGKTVAELTNTRTLVSRLSYLYDASMTLRGVLMQQAVACLQNETNKYLEQFFDAPIRVELTLEDSDRIEVVICNGGYEAAFKALSGGERCMLKLAFSLSLMRLAQERAGVAFGQIFLDEPMNGLDTGLKGNAFGLLQKLARTYPTVMVIEHDEEIKNMFDKKYTVTKSNGNSTVTQE